MKKLLVTGSSGLIGSEVCLHFAAEGWEIHGIDNNQRAVFFGPLGDTRWNQHRLESAIKGFVHHELDIRDRQGVLDLLKQLQPDAVVLLDTSDAAGADGGAPAGGSFGAASGCGSEGALTTRSVNSTGLVR